jgi:transcriptional regulator with XRE-family HTH domain
VGPETAFSQVLKKLRKTARLSQEELASRSNLDRTYISLLERSLRQPSLASIINISKALKIPASELIKKVEECLNESHEN